MRHGADWWEGLVAELVATGDARGIARKHGVRESTLIWWRSELPRRARAAKGPRLLPVVVRSAPARPSSTRTPIGDLEVFVEIGSARMTLRGAVSAEHVAAIVTASSQTC